MKNERFLLIISLFLSLVLCITSCQKDSVNKNLSSSPESTQDRSVTNTPLTVEPTPNLNSPIRKIDFKNFTYSWTEDLMSDDEKNFTLKNGEIPFVMNEQMGVSLSTVEYGDVTNDGQDEAFINLGIQTEGSSVPNMIYVYSIEKGKPKLLWSFDTGDRAEGGFKKIYAENSNLVVETFGDNKFENGKWDFRMSKDKPTGLCCPSTYTKIIFKWNGEKFVPFGERQVFDYDWKKNQGK